MQGLKDWLIDVALKQMGPSALRGAILGAMGWLAAHNGWLDPFGVHTANGVTTIEWAKVSMAAIAGLPAVGAAVIKALNYHGTQFIKGDQQ
jgi:hypothetical protein